LEALDSDRSKKHIEKELKHLNKIPESQTEEENAQLIKELTTGNLAMRAETDRDAEEKITLFLEKADWNGYEFHSHLLEQQILSKYKEKLVHFETKNNETLQKIMSNNEFSNLLAMELQNNSGDLKLILKEPRSTKSWLDKAKLVGLEDEYEQFYRFSSSLMHFGSYSIFTNPETNEEEISMLYRMMTQYIKKILENINGLCRLEYADTFQVYYVTE